MKFSSLFAIFVIAISSMNMRAIAENVYRCGNNYSQQPCPEGVRVNVQDARTTAQKAESDAATQRASSAANAMERERVKKEAQLLAANAKAAVRSKKNESAPKTSPKKKKRQHKKR